jgi:two-component system chemotaxis response regulator CheB
MLCDDSPTARAILTRLLGSDPAVQVVARVGDGQQALDALPTARPDVVLLDLEMPVMDGMTALPLLLRADPRPVVIVASALTQRGAAAAMAALRGGASDYIPKPGAAGGGAADAVFRAELLEKVKGWARMRRGAALPGQPRRTIPAAVAPPPGTARPQMVVVGSSTGGPQVLAALLRAMGPPPDMPMLIVQHMPAGFTTMLADHLNRIGVLAVAEAQDGEILRAGRAYLAPGDRHLLVEREAGGLVARLRDDPPEHFCRPALDPTLRSAARACDGRVLAVVLTGMGHDGLAGCRILAAAGGTVLAQDEASSVVWGMPGAVVRAGLAQEVLPPERLARRITALAAGSGRIAS